MLLAACSVKPGPVTLMKQNVPPDALPCGGCKHCIKRDLEWKDFNNMIDDVIPLSKINSEEHIYPKCHRECPLGVQYKDNVTSAILKIQNCQILTGLGKCNGSSAKLQNVIIED